jgi:hypothetical protein
MPKKKPVKPAPVEVDIRVVITGKRGLNKFARFLRVLHDNGFPDAARSFVSALEKEAKMQGIAFPDDLTKWVKANA